MQHPAFDEFKRAFGAKNYEQALACIEQLQQEFPQSAALMWHRANCLEKLERYIDLPQALEAAIAKLPEHLPARVMRVEYSDWYIEHEFPLLDGEEDADEDNLPSEILAIREKREQRGRELEQRNEADLRFVLEKEPQHAHANFLLSQLLRSVEQHTLSAEEREVMAADLLERAIASNPKQVDYYLARAAHHRSLAWCDWSEQDAAQEVPAHIVKTFSGIAYLRAPLEAAAQDYRQAWSLSQQPAHALKLATTLHDLGSFDEALAVYDDALAKMPEDAPLREYFIERRAMSENGGAGEREHMAQLLLQGLGDDGKEQTLADSIATQAILGAAEAIRRGASVSDAIAANISDDPETMRAMNLARQLLNVANEPAPELVEVDASKYPAHQRRFADKTERAAEKIGMIKICDAEAMGLFQRLGQHVMLRFYRDDSGEVGMASFTLKHKWPGFVAFVILFLMGKWKAHSMVECVTTFDDGTLISTQPESISPFQYGGGVILRKLSKNVSVQELVTVHKEMVADYKLQHPEAKPRIVTDLAGVEARWIEGQEIKSAYRKSINYATDEELRAMLGGQYEALADKIRTQIQLMTA
ncbi:tetratricopeptide repeat protein [Undibacterium cyanobacteriorum]|uniref:Tetratricopeptide repeat protein n=1 Tax=Undibacterium cyanobacteriorum TaxID=3073561 RepID=A0ABY9RGG4_9BURK|nr:tetratricopeptide repeat protein [Undibacterium sp. 20NA77.5]WMW79948.1 tetratricopeptide repeat protein [Undibacterium sp. 20NA77.5]